LFTQNLNGKVAIVSGGSKGIGRAIVEKIGELGCRVYFINRNRNEGEQAEKEIVAHGLDVEFFQGDVSDPTQVNKLASKVLDKNGKIDYLVNNAAIFHLRALERETIKSFNEMVNTNLKGCFLLTQKVIPIMKQKKEGVIVNIASMNGYKAERETSIYSMTKGGLISFSRAIAYELADYGIRVLSISPGNVLTPLLKKEIVDESKMRNMPPERIEREYARVSMLRRMAQPGEIASVVAFCLTDMASFITGCDILVDGGAVAKSYDLTPV
jgi:3-oxoacyl-[acyl-carrier protein] reductase